MAKTKYSPNPLPCGCGAVGIPEAVGGIMPFKIESGYSLYRVVGPDGEEGDAVEYGTPAFLEIGHHLFMVYIDDPNEFGEHEGQLYELTTLPRGICRHRGRSIRAALPP